ncbi:MAG: hypothetical protein IT173_06400 [Acidobacteria bacterium]|nr:hypothetical protein [Acidobacteriota bacterium]
MRTPEEKLLNPTPGSKIAAARDYGIDLTQLVENLRLTPQQRLEKLQTAMISMDKLRRAAVESRNETSDSTPSE